MELVIADQIRLLRTPDGATWARGWGGYAQFAAFRGDFDKVNVACRLEPADAALADAARCDGPVVSFVGMPYYVGAAQYLRAAAAVRKRIRESYKPDAAYLLRMPSQMGSLFMSHLQKKRHPFGVIVVADPFKDFDRNSCGHPAWRLFQWHYTKMLVRACKDATSVAYVTSESLQKRYPPGEGFVTDFSDVVLTDEWFLLKSRDFQETATRPWKLLHIGAFNQFYKGQDTLLKAIACLRDKGIKLELTFVGDGRYRPRMERLAGELRLQGIANFAGEIPHGEQIRRALDASDLFVLPSRTEGLPRALLEAMARGLPCVATEVGGVPELLDSTSLVPPDNVGALSERIRLVLSSSERLAEMSSRNLEVARRYHWTRTSPRRSIFLNHLRAVTETWLKERRSR